MPTGTVTVGDHEYAYEYAAPTTRSLWAVSFTRWIPALMSSNSGKILVLDEADGEEAVVSEGLLQVRWPNGTAVTSIPLAYVLSITSWEAKPADAVAVPAAGFRLPRWAS
jgi:hypothetical protein